MFPKCCQCQNPVNKPSCTLYTLGYIICTFFYPSARLPKSSSSSKQVFPLVDACLLDRNPSTFQKPRSCAVYQQEDPSRGTNDKLSRFMGELENHESCERPSPSTVQLRPHN